MEAKVLEEERQPSSLGKDETNALFLEIENLRKENEKLKHKLSEGQEIPVSVCMTCFQDLRAAGYKARRENISPMETETEQHESVTQEPIDDTAVTQEPTVKAEPPVIIDLDADPQEPMEAMPIIEEKTVDTEATLGKNKGADT